MAVPTMPRSSSGEFHAVFSPCVAVKTPPRGGPTSSPNTSVTPMRSSPTWSAMRIAWTIVAMAELRLPSDLVLLGEDVVPDRSGRRLRLLPHALARVEELLREALPVLVH